jgi:RES domain-containing protein
MIPLTELRRFDTHRLLPAKYSPHDDSVLTRLSDDDDELLQQIFELDNATNGRLLAEEGRSLGIDAKELVYHVPNYRVINAAFTHANPLGARFSTPERGAWYAAFELATAKAEVIYHKSIEFAEINWQQREEVGYDDYLADFTAPFHDLRGLDDEALSPVSYKRSQQLAVELMEAASQGIIYPSVRREGGTCLVCFRPSVVGNVRKSARYTLIWTPQRARLVRQEKTASP